MDFDILKLLVVLTASVYFNLKIKSQMKSVNCWLVNIGLCLLLFASLLDFTDGISKISDVPILGSHAPFHDILEDQLGDTLGLALFILGVFKQILKENTKFK
jgi:hypothetical protein